MIGGIAWPDIVIVVVLAIATLKGWSRGFVSELGGAFAVTAGLVAPWFYGGWFDGQIEAVTKVGPGSAHVIGMFLTGLLAYIVVVVIARLLNRHRAPAGTRLRQCARRRGDRFLQRRGAALARALYRALLSALARYPRRSAPFAACAVSHDVR